MKSCGACSILSPSCAWQPVWSLPPRNRPERRPPWNFLPFPRAKYRRIFPYRSVFPRTTCGRFGEADRRKAAVAAPSRQQTRWRSLRRKLGNGSRWSFPDFSHPIHKPPANILPSPRFMMAHVTQETWGRVGIHPGGVGSLPLQRSPVVSPRLPSVVSPVICAAVRHHPPPRLLPRR